MRRLILAVIVLLAGLSPAAALAQKLETFRGYAEWRHGDELIVDGQRIRIDRGTALKGAAKDGAAAIQLGWEITVKGARLADGSVAAREVDGKPNGQGIIEAQILSATNAQEQQWLQSGGITTSRSDGQSVLVGKVAERGPAVDRVRQILLRVAPPYIDAKAYRVYVVDSKEWNAMAMANGSVWVFRGLLDDMNDDEVAVVVGHELAHVTHEHSRREFTKALWVQALALGIIVTAETIDNSKTRAAVQIASGLSAMAWQNHFSRDAEEQADRVGLRYAYQGGYDATRAPQVWERFRDKYHDDPKVLNFFFGDHPRGEDRVARLQQQVAFNYGPGATRMR
jgi:Zn-dependent protease with chaperone function